MWKDSDIEITHLKGGGPGGQHRNKRMTGIRLVHKPTGIVVLATERRSQSQNLRNALERLEERLRRHFHKAPPRVSTHKSASGDRKRFEEKTTRSRLKRERKKVARSWENWE